MHDHANACIIFYSRTVIAMVPCLKYSHEMDACFQFDYKQFTCFVIFTLC